MRDSTPAILLMLVLASFAVEAKFASSPLFPVHGQWTNNDQMLVIPAAYAVSGGGYFDNDLAIQEYVKAYPTLLFQVLAGAYSLVGDMRTAYFLLFFVLKLIFVPSTFLLARLLLKDEKLALLATAALAFTHFMGAEEIGVSEVVAKGVAFAFIPLILYVFLKDPKKGSLPAFAGLGVLTYFHVITALPLVAALSYLLLRSKDYRMLAMSVLLFAAITALFFLEAAKLPAVDAASLRDTAPYSTLETGGRTVLKYVPLVAVGWWAARRKDKRVSGMMGVLTAYSMLSLLTLFSDAFLPYAFFRASRFVIFLSYIFATWAIFGSWKTGLAAKLLVFAALILLPFSSIFYSNLLPVMQTSTAVSETPDLIKVGAWLDSNSVADTVVLAPVEWPALRVWSKRSLVIAEDDLWVGSVRPSVQDELVQRYADVKAAYATPTEASLAAAANKYGATYVVVHGILTDLPVNFSSGKFNVYAIPSARS